jgi:phosphate uptake regulator
MVDGTKAFTDEEVDAQVKQALEAIEHDVNERRVETVEEAALLLMDSKELARIGDRGQRRAKKVLKGYDPGQYGEVRMWLEAANREYPDMEAVHAFYAEHGAVVPMKPAQASIHVEFIDGGS